MEEKFSFFKLRKQQLLEAKQRRIKKLLKVLDKRLQSHLQMIGVVLINFIQP